MACVLKDKSGNVLSRARLKENNIIELSEESVSLLKAAFDFRFKDKPYNLEELFEFSREALRKVSEFDENYNPHLIASLQEGGVLYNDFRKLSEANGKVYAESEVLNSVYAVIIYSPEKTVFKPAELREYINNVIVGFNPVLSGTHKPELLRTINKQFMEKVIESVCSSAFYEEELKLNKIEYGSGSFIFVESNLKDYIAALIGLKKPNQMIDEMVAYMLSTSAK